MKDSNVLDKVALVYGQMNEPPGNRLRVAPTGLTMAEHFRDEGLDAVLRRQHLPFHAGRYRSVGTARPYAVGRAISRRWLSEMGKLQERITSTKKGLITSVHTVYVPADDLTDPSPATTFGYLDATVVLSRDIASLGIYPAVDPLDSTSRQIDPNVIGEEHY